MLVKGGPDVRISNINPARNKACVFCRFTSKRGSLIISALQELNMPPLEMNFDNRCADIYIYQIQKKWLRTLQLLARIFDDLLSAVLNSNLKDRLFSRLVYLSINTRVQVLYWFCVFLCVNNANCVRNSSYTKFKYMCATNLLSPAK